MTKFFAFAAATALAASPALAGESCESTCPMSGGVVVTPAAATEFVDHHKEGTKTPDIVDTAASIKDFSTLVAAVKAAGLVETLKSKGPFTVFAPTNAAFAKLPEGTVAELLKPENKQKLTDILLYHVVPGKVMAADVVKVTSANTALADKKVTVKVEDGKVFIDNAKVTKTDVVVGNGVIHIIDAVILP